MRTRHPLQHRLAAGLTAGSSSSSSSGSGSTESSASEQTGPEVATAAADAREKAGAVRVAGTMGSGAEAQTIDLFLQGEDVTGSITVSGQTGDITLDTLGQELRAASDGAFDDEVGTDTIDGTDVAVLSRARGTIYVAADDPMYPLRVEDTGSDAGTLDLSEFGACTLHPPAQRRSASV